RLIVGGRALWTRLWYGSGAVSGGVKFAVCPLLRAGPPWQDQGFLDDERGGRQCRGALFAQQGEGPAGQLRPSAVDVCYHAVGPGGCLLLRDAACRTSRSGRAQRTPSAPQR